MISPKITLSCEILDDCGPRTGCMALFYFFIFICCDYRALHDENWNFRRCLSSLSVDKVD